MRSIRILLLLIGMMMAAYPSLSAAERSNCGDGEASGRPCSRVDLLAHMSVVDIGGGTLNDIWGWTEPETGSEYVLVGRFDGTSFVDISDPENPVYLGELPSHEDADSNETVGRPHGCHDDCDIPLPEGAEGSSWRDIKVHANHAYIVSEEDGHGLQVFDLTQLRDVADPPVSFSETAHYDGFGSAHNLGINSDTDTAFALGSNTFSGGLHMVDISNPAAPVEAGGYAGDGYTHDAQCVIWEGPDEAYAGEEVCFASNEDTLTIVGLADRSSPELIAKTDYPRTEYVHQGWLSEDHRWFYVNDELSDRESGTRTRTLVWDVSDLDDPELVEEYSAPSLAIHHNNYVRGEYLFQSNYTSGLRILDISRPDAPVEFGFLDSQPDSDEAVFEGTWSNYPWFPSGTVAFSDIEGGLYLVRPALPEEGDTDADIQLTVTEEESATGGDFRQAASYRVQIENQGPAAVDDLGFVASLPAGSEFELPGESPGSCEGDGHILRCSGTGLESGASLVFDLVARTDGGVDEELVVMATSERADPDTRDNRTGMAVPGAGGSPFSSSSSGCSLGGSSPAQFFLVLVALGGLFVRRHGRRRSAAGHSA